MGKSAAAARYRRLSCDVPVPPENGRFSCDTIGSSSNVANNGGGGGLTIPSGSVCRVLCDDDFEINNEVAPFAVFRCGPDGYWNSTMMDFCTSAI